MNSYTGTREAVTCALLEMAQNDSRVMMVSADSRKAMRADVFLQEYPNRIVEVGIAEQNALAVASGLASCGLVPFVATYAGFLTMRACEQLRTFIAYPGLNVKLIGINGGLLGGEREGVTHQFFEDLGIVRSIPGITVLTPADAGQAYGAVKASLHIPGPVYIRCASGREADVYPRGTPFTFGKVNTVHAFGNQVAIFANGFILPLAIEACERLHALGIEATLVDVPTLKPIDEERVSALLAQCGAAVCVEDHNIIGGLGSAIAEMAVQYCPVPLERVGLRDLYPESGPADALLACYGISAQAIMDAAKRAIARKA